MTFIMRCVCVLLLLVKLNCLAQVPVSELKSKLKVQADAHKVDTYLSISHAYTLTEPDSAVAYCNEGIRFAEKLNNWQGQALLLLELGRINALHHHVQLARRFDNEALDIYHRLNDKAGIARAYDELGLLEGLEQNLPSAVKDLSQAMSLYQNAHDSAGVTDTYFRLGTVYDEKGDTDKALSYYLQALVKYDKKEQKPEQYYEILKRVGHLYLKKGDNASALHYLEKGVHSNGGTAMRDSEITLLNEEGKIYEQNGEKTRALQYYKQALQEAKTFNRPEEEAQALINIAGVLKKEHTAQSISDLKQALKIATNLHQPKLEASIYAAMASAYSQEKDYKEAMAALEEQHHLLDSLMNADTAKDIAALDSSYELESSREKIQNLQQVNKLEEKELDMGFVALAVVLGALVFLWIHWRKVRRLNQDLKASNQIKDTLFSIIGHDLKGPAGTTAQLFAMMETEEFTEEELRGMIGQLRKQTTASFELLTALFEWGRAQMQGVKVEPTNFNVSPIISNNVSLLGQQAARKKIIIYNHIPQGYVLFADFNHFDFIVRNLLSNAIKFTNKGGLIEVDAHDDGKDVTFSVKDNGKGISLSQQKQFSKTSIKVTFGTGGEKGSGLGLLLIKEFVKANKGKIWLESTEGQGTTFYFTLPKGIAKTVTTEQAHSLLA